MPRIGGTSGKRKQIRKSIARKKKIPRGAVRSSLIKKRLRTRTPFRQDKIFPGIKVRLWQGETAQQAYKRAKWRGRESGKN